ncbi:MAG: hypothetical protein GY703_01235 [Gammaproteobacteria bacterium]|nr:hypothetical protein [Gammaproteobacteria bacterium]
MKFDISDEESHKAKIPHEIFLTNLVGNHILWFIASLGIANSYIQPLLLVPVLSAATLTYILWRSHQSKNRDSWYVMCHWQICARRSRMFTVMLMFMVVVSGLGWIGYSQLGLMKEAAYALVGGLGILPVMVTVLVLILLESDILHQAALRKLPKRIVDQYSGPDMPAVVEESVST